MQAARAGQGAVWTRLASLERVLELGFRAVEAEAAGSIGGAR